RAQHRIGDLHLAVALVVDEAGGAQDIVGVGQVAGAEHVAGQVVGRGRLAAHRVGHEVLAIVQVVGVVGGVGAGVGHDRDVAVGVVGGKGGHAGVVERDDGPAVRVVEEEGSRPARIGHGLKQTVAPDVGGDIAQGIAAG